MYVCIYVCINLYILITYVFNHLLLFLLSLLYLIYICVFGTAHLLWILLEFEFFPVNSESPLPSPSLIQNIRLLHSYLLLSWCAKIRTYL